MITLSHLSIGYKDGGNKRKTVAADLNATLSPARLTCIVGSNGCGKSTLLRTIAALQPAMSGETRFYDDDKRDTSFQTIDTHTPKEQLARLISVVLTDRPAIRNITVGEIVALGRQPYTGFWGILGRDDREIVEQSMRLVGIRSLAERYVQTLSDGERQEMMIAKAIAQQTPVIILDEPTAFLDYPSKAETFAILKRLCRERGKTVLLSTHDIAIALQLADTLWLMELNDNGSSLVTGTPAELAASGILSRFTDRGGIRLDRRTLSLTLRDKYS